MGPELTSQIVLPSAQKQFFGLKYLNSFIQIRIRDGKQGLASIQALFHTDALNSALYQQNKLSKQCPITRSTVKI
jgi:hypothetical protein